MTLDEATKDFLRYVNESEPEDFCDCARSLELLKRYFSGDSTLDRITPAAVRDFLARYYIENAVHVDLEFQAVIKAMARFAVWCDRSSGSNLTGSLSIIRELEQAVPRAITITRTLSKALAESKGAFSFPEFLTSFEDGGHSEYDIGSPGEVGAREGYFRIIRVEGARVEAEETITEERMWPIIFPLQIAEHLAEGYIINLEVIRTPNGWQITDCGLAYPPGTDF